MIFQIFVTIEGEEEYEITDLYWFEENMVHSFDQKMDGNGHKLEFRFYPPIDDQYGMDEELL
jgi:hypothetical protein